MDERFAAFPRDLRERSRRDRLGADVPAMLAHPDWERPAPLMIWMHGRTVSKELDPGRYLRWIRAGIAACALDLPGHGERLDPQLQGPAHTLDVVAQMRRELDSVVESLSNGRFKGLFDLSRLGIGGMSAGGMVTLRRLCDPHPFTCAAVEATTGWLEGLYFPDRHGLSPVARWLATHDEALVRDADPSAHLTGFRPIPLLALHAQTDQMVPFEGMRRFIDDLRRHYQDRGADPAMIQLQSWSNTAAPQEHAGFGKFGNDAKNAQVEFLTRWLRPSIP